MKGFLIRPGKRVYFRCDEVGTDFTKHILAGRSCYGERGMSHENGQGDALQAALDSMPEVMAALMKQYIEKKDVTSRTDVRLRMKALLDFAGVDTEYPPNPLLKKEASQGPQLARDAVIADAQGLIQGMPYHGQSAEVPGPAPLPRRGIDNSDIARVG